MQNEFPGIIERATHVIFNSLSQCQEHIEKLKAAPRAISAGIRINTLHSVSTRAHYDPCSKGSRFGIRAEELHELPAGVEGLHVHVHCENTSIRSLVETIEVLERDFGKHLAHIKWINLGGGLVVTDDAFETEELVELLKSFRSRYPHLDVYMEPGAAYVWNAGFLLTTIQDIIVAEDEKIAVIDASFEAHLNDTLLGWRPQIAGAKDLSPSSNPELVYRVGGVSCAACDVLDPYELSERLSEETD